MVEGGDGGCPFECAVAAMVVVEVDEATVGDLALEFACPVLDVGPFLEQDPVEPFDLAVGLWDCQIPGVTGMA